MFNSWGQILNWCKPHISFINLAVLIFTENHLHNFQSIILHASCPECCLTGWSDMMTMDVVWIGRDRSLKGSVWKSQMATTTFNFFPVSQICFAAGLCFFIPNEPNQNPMYLFPCIFQFLRETSMGTIIQSPSLILLIYHPGNAVT